MWARVGDLRADGTRSSAKGWPASCWRYFGRKGRKPRCRAISEPCCPRACEAQASIIERACLQDRPSNRALACSSCVALLERLASHLAPRWTEGKAVEDENDPERLSSKTRWTRALAQGSSVADAAQAPGAQLPMSASPLRALALMRLSLAAGSSVDRSSTAARAPGRPRPSCARGPGWSGARDAQAQRRPVESSARGDPTPLRQDRGRTSHAGVRSPGAGAHL